MSLFLLWVALLIGLALLLLLPTLLRRKSLPRSAAQDGPRANVLVLREQLATLDAERANGVLDEVQHRLARIEIERRALDEAQAVEQLAVAGRAGKTALALGLSIPVLVVVIYGVLGDPRAIAPLPAAAAGGASGEMSAAQIEAMVERLSQRLEAKTTVEAGDVQAWAMLARSFTVLQRYAEASRAFTRALGLAPNDAQLLADHAEVLAMVQGQDIRGEPNRLITRALQLEPKNVKALALAGSAAFQRNEFRVALDYWGQAQQLVPPGSEFAAGLESSIQLARAQLAGATQSAPIADSASATAPASAAASQSPAGPIAPTSGVVQLAGALAGRVEPNDTLFVFARAAQGPRLPLAILKRKASELPLRFALDDSSAMSPEFTLSKFPSVVVGARISRSGDATPHSGDLVGQIGPVDTGAGKLVIVIDRVQP